MQDRTALYLLAEPKLGDADRLWLDGLRQRHDPQHSLVAPHFTLVFPAAELDETSLLDRAREVAAGQRPISFCLRRALAFADPQEAAHHAFLVPEEGYADLAGLHGALHRGPLVGALRMDIPFVPHVTVGVFAERAAASDLVGRLQTQDFALHGTIGALCAVKRSGQALTTIGRFALA